MDYKGQYQSPHWQKKRLSIMKRDNFQCQMCFDTETQLHVHHKKYKKDRKVWEYRNDNFITLCEDCHNRLHEAIKNDSFQLQRAAQFRSNICDIMVLEWRLLKLAQQQPRTAIKVAIQLITSHVIKKEQI